MELWEDKQLVDNIDYPQDSPYFSAPEYFDFYGNRHRIRKKLVYHRKYHIINVMSDIAQKNNIQIGYYNRELLRYYYEFYREQYLIFSFFSYPDEHCKQPLLV